MRSAPLAGRDFSPLDEELALLPGGLTPTLVEQSVHLATWMPFAPAGRMVQRLLHVAVSEATVRRHTEQAGAAYVAVQGVEVEQLERETPPAPAGPERQQVSVDGAMVPLVGGEWAEVKTLAIGTIGKPVWEGGAWAVHTHDLSYFSRLADHETFGRLAMVETYRRGTETAGRVVAVVDGADWEQGFIDLHCPDAVRILDWGHAAEHVVQAGQALFGVGTAATSEWLGVQLHELRHGEPERVLHELRVRQEQLAAAGESPALAVVRGRLAYLEKRRAQIRYAEFEAQGYPIGSGAVESANKLVVEARLKGAGMHWARTQVNPMVALRTAVCSDRWDAVWAQVQLRLRQDARARTAVRRASRQQAQAAPTPPAVPGVAAPTPTPPPTPIEPECGSPPRRAPTIVHGRPTPDHPWKQQPLFPRRCISAKR
jgi:hypothetical protein